jgi:hypothetical protein
MDLIPKKNRSQVNSKAALTREWEKIPQQEFPSTSASSSSVCYKFVSFVQEVDGSFLVYTHFALRK